MNQEERRPHRAGLASRAISKLTAACADLRSLPAELESELLAQHEQDVEKLLPVLGPLFGLGVMLFSAWDYVIDPYQAPSTILIRLGFVLLGALAYVPTRLRWSPVQRCGFIFWTHAFAVIISTTLLSNGLWYGLTGVAVCVFAVSVVTIRIQTFLAIVSLPSLLFVMLVVFSGGPSLIVLNSLMRYFFSINVAGIVMLVIASFRRKAFILEKELLHISRHDSLTGAFNRGYLTELAEREVQLARRHGRSLAALMLDIDHFKRVNDTWGHAKGDDVIRSLVATCLGNLRSIDYFGRIGGEEFVCLLPDTGTAEALDCAERLRRKVESVRVDTMLGPLQFTVSIGVALLAPRHAEWSALLKDADTALYRAKAQGRNRVVLAPSEDGETPAVIHPMLAWAPRAH